MNKSIVLFDIDYTLFDTKNFKDSKLKKYTVYPEIIRVLTKLQNKVILGIFSEGEKDFQMQKIQSVQLQKYFLPENIHIFLNKKNEILKLFKKYHEYKMYFVDDKLTVLQLAKKSMPECITVWVKRGYYAENEKNDNNFIPDYSVDSLEKIDQIICT